MQSGFMKMPDVLNRVKVRSVRGFPLAAIMVLE